MPLSAPYLYVRRRKALAAAVAAAAAAAMIDATCAEIAASRVADTSEVVAGVTNMLPVTFLLSTMPVVRLQPCRSVLALAPSVAHATPPEGGFPPGGVTHLCDGRLYAPVVSKFML